MGGAQKTTNTGPSASSNLGPSRSLQEEFEAMQKNASVAQLKQQAETQRKQARDERGGTSTEKVC